MIKSRGKNKAQKMIWDEKLNKLVPKKKIKYGWNVKMEEFLNEKRREKYNENK